MPYKDKEKERAWHKAYRAAHIEEHRERNRKYRERNREKLRAWAREYNASPEGKAYLAEYYLKNRVELRKKDKENYILKGYKTAVTNIKKQRETRRKYARRKRLGIVIDFNEQGFFWKAGKLWNGYFRYKKEAIKDSERAFGL